MNARVTVHVPNILLKEARQTEGEFLKWLAKSKAEAGARDRERAKEQAEQAATEAKLRLALGQVAGDAQDMTAESMPAAG